ncbi:Zinc finger protein GLI1 [Frankliniella fusca]|uniref:Zinc finger protein GLI1 n=1 Tax=Frankliniella fusca TaxID=407009 RepID=A0AAE1LT48_9NEOP|nr:Zinc finger protein GLI1 [Frankliniella fusca]
MDLTCRTCFQKFSNCSAHVDHFELYHRVLHKSAFLCGVKDCPTKINDLSSYKKHIVSCHLSSDNAAEAELPYKCAVPDCNFRAKSKATLRQHKFWQHRSSQPPNQEEGPFVSSISEEAAPFNTVVNELFLNDVESNLETNGATENLMSEEDICLKLTHLSLTLNTKYHVPDSTVGHVINSYSKLLTESLKITAKRLVDSLSNSSEEKVENVVQSIIRNDPLLKLQGPDGPLRSSYSRLKQYDKVFKCVKPTQINLGLNDANIPCKYHYVPIKESLKQFFNDNSVYQQYVENRQKRQSVFSSDDLTDIHSGSTYRNNLFWDDLSRIEIILYQDEVDLCKAIGAAAGTHKVLHMAYTLANLSPWNRSKVDPIQLILLAKETDVSYFGLIKILEPLIRDLKDFEENGFEIRGEILKASIAVLLGDNLGTHMIGGFVPNFSASKYFCRYCEESRSEWRKRWAQNTPECGESENSESESDSESEEDSDDEGENDEGNDCDEDEEDSDDDDCLEDLIPLSELRRRLTKVTEPLRTVQSYQRCVDELDRHPEGVKGIVADSQLNQLKHFHIIGGAGPCLPHDVFEGFAGYDLQLCLKRLCSLNKFKFEYINRRLKTFRFEGKDKLDKPPAKQTKTRKKIKGNAVQVWTLIRNYPPITSPVVAKSSLNYIGELILKYLNVRVSVFKAVPLRPKHHFFEHYKHLLSVYGPLMRISTLRFEAKHKYFRAEFVNKKCVKNITKSLTYAHQAMQSAFSINNMFELNPVMADTFTYPSLKLDDAGVRCLLSSFGADIVPKLSYSFEVTFHNTSYKAGKVVVIDTASRSKIKCLKMDLFVSDGVTAYALGCRYILS